MKLFRENGQVIAVIVSLVVVAVLLSGQIGRVEDRLTGRIYRVEERIDGVEERLTARIDRVEARIDRVEARIGRVEDRVHSIEVFLRGDRVGSGEEAQ
ncbi:MAG: hypothetical protein OXU74_05870 [Gemmatimonadota bacterium]|nr:hypothetical protein [Gemmatimonadota bacterium]